MLKCPKCGRYLPVCVCPKLPPKLPTVPVTTSTLLDVVAMVWLAVMGVLALGTVLAAYGVL